MKNHFWQKISIFKYFWFFIIGLLSVVTTIYIYLVWQYNINNSVSTLKTQSSRIEKSFTDTLDYTAYLMEYLNSQIKDNKYSNLHYIDNLLSSFRLHQDVHNKIAWNMFSWINKDSKLVVNSDRGIVAPIDVSDRDYLQAAKKNFGVMHLGKLVYGKVSNRLVIPAGMAISDSKGDFLGAMVFGIQIEKLVFKLSDSLTSSEVDFAFFSKNGELIFKSQDFIVCDDILRKIKKVNIGNNSGILTKISAFNSKSILSYYQKVDKYPYVIVVSYDRAALQKLLISKLLPYLFELLLILLVLFVIFFCFKRFVISPISILSLASQNIARKNNQNIAIPRSKIPEIHYLSKAILSVKKFVNKEGLLKSRLQKTNEELSKLNSSLTSLSKAINHEIRNYVVGVSNLANFIVESDDDSKKQKEQNREYARLIARQSNEMLDFSTDLLDVELNTVDVGSFISEKNCNVKKLLEEIIFISQEFLKKQQVEIELIIKDDLPLLRYNQRKLRQILNNLIVNAVKYTKKGGLVQIFVKYLKSEEKIYIEVADKGIGMSKQEIKMALLGKGKDIDKSALDKEVDSHGIGLPFVAELVQMLGAKMEIESEKGVGTKVKLWFSVLHDSNNTKKSVGKKDKTILVTDDEEVNLMILEKILVDAGFKVIKARNGKEALKVLDKQHCDLIFMDVKMPELDGIATTKLIREGKTLKKGKSYKSIPIISISANNDEESIKNALDSGMNFYLPKPFNKNKVLEVVYKL